MGYEELHAAWLAFRRHKKPSRSIDEFAYYLEANLRLLVQDIGQHTYRHGTYQTVVVHEKKRRDLAVASVRDRVVHRLVYDELVRVFNPTLDPDVWSCRPKKGLYGCLERTQGLLRRHVDAYIWRIDIAKFFDHVHHDTLRACLARRELRPQTMELSEQVITSFCRQPGVGIPIGNLTSQIFANIYLNEFDRYVRHTLKPLAYVRYGDDVVMWARNHRDAHYFREQSVHFLRHALKMEINPRSDVLFRSCRGLHFLGHVITSSYIVVDRHTTRSVLGKSSSRSIASYKSLRLASMPKKQLNWQLLDELNGRRVL